MPKIGDNTNGNCRFCGSDAVGTTDSRPGEHPGWRRRRRKCAECGKRWTSMELPIEDIEKMLHITMNLNELSEAAMKVHTEIEALKKLRPDPEDEPVSAPTPPIVNRTRDMNITEELTLQELGVLER